MVCLSTRGQFLVRCVSASLTGPDVVLLSFVMEKHFIWFADLFQGEMIHM